MSMKLKLVLAMSGALVLAGCGNSGLFRRANTSASTPGADSTPAVVDQETRRAPAGAKGTIWSLFKNSSNPDVTIEVNKYIWKASLDVLSFLPVEAADPFSGVIVMGWGRPKGSSRQYRATVYIQDPALDARSLRVAIMTRSGPASAATVRAIEDAILTRARELRIADGKL